MAKDYFQDIVPPRESVHKRSRRSSTRVHAHTVVDKPEDPTEERSGIQPSSVGLSSNSIAEEVGIAPIKRGIRNVSVPTRPRMRVDDSPLGFSEDEPPLPSPRNTFSGTWLWILSAVCVIALACIALLYFRPTTVSVIPRTRMLTFDQTTQFTSYPVALAASGTLPYTVFTRDLDESASVPSIGTVHQETKASGSVTVYNNYATTPVRLIKTTRFEAGNGLVFRAPSDIVIPGKIGTQPGHVDITIIADQVGSQYNIPSGTRFTLPGLQSNTAMYNGVYAMGRADFGGGFSGDQAGVDPTVRANTISQLRATLEKKVRDAIGATSSSDSTVFPDLVRISYQDKPDESDGQNSIKIVEHAHVETPVFPASLFAQAIAQALSVADVETSDLSLEGTSADYGAHLVNASSTILGADPLVFTLGGEGRIVWRVDKNALAQALAGRNQGAFKTIIQGFPGIQEAHARIEPFWQDTFPKDPSKITITIEPPSDSPATSS